MTGTDKALAKFANAHRARAGTMAGLRELASAVADKMPLRSEGNAAMLGAAETFGGKIVSARDQVHVFIACCRHLGIPARFVSGYVHTSNVTPNGFIAGHAWAEAWISDQWRGFNLANSSAKGKAYLALSVGADYLDACPIRGVRVGGGIETMRAEARVTVEQ